MYTFFSPLSYIHLLQLKSGVSETPSFHEKTPEKKLGFLTPEQQKTWENVMNLLKKNTDAQEKLKKSWGNLLDTIIQDPEKLERLLYGIEAAKQEKLDAIQKEWDANKITSTEATKQSTQIITHYTRVALTVIQQLVDAPKHTPDAPSRLTAQDSSPVSDVPEGVA